MFWTLLCRFVMDNEYIDWEGVRITMKNVKDKIIITAAVGLTAAAGITSNNAIPVFAEENKNVETVDNTVKAPKTEKEKLESSVTTAKGNLDDVTAIANDKKQAVDESKKVVDTITSEKEAQQTVVDNRYNEIYNSVYNDYSDQLSTLNELEANIKSQQDQLDEYQKKADQAEKNLASAKSNLDEKNKTLEDLQKKLKSYDKTALDENLQNATEAQEEAKKAYEVALSNKNDAQAAYDKANTDVQTKQSALDVAKTKYDNAVADLETKQKAYDAAKSESDSYNKEGAMDEANNQLADYRQQLEQAQATTTVAESTLNTATSELNAATEAQKTAQFAYNQCVSDLETAQNNLNTAKETQKQAQDNFNTADTNYKDNQKLIDQLNTDYEKALNEQKAAQDAYYTAKENYYEGKTDKELAKEKLDAFEAEHKDELDRLTQGIQGYFDSIGASAATDILKNPRGILAGYTNIGADGDATSLENVLATIQYLKECNQIRENEGLSSLKVSMVLMAMAEVNVNWSNANTKINDPSGHSQVYNVAENLAWGYGPNSYGGSPYKGWYTEEKAVYDYMNEKGWTLDDIFDSQGNVIDQVKADDIVKNCNLNSAGFIQVGHYENIVNPQYEFTGYARLTGGAYGSTDGQEFDLTRYTINEGINSDKDKIMTVDDFEQSLNSYITKLNDIKSQHENLVNEWKNASDTKSDTALTQAYADLQAKNQRISDLNTYGQSLATEHNRLGNIRDDASSALTASNNDVNDKQAIFNELTNQKDAKSTALDTAKANVETKTKAKADAEKAFNEAKNNQAKIQGNVDTVQSKIDNWNENKKAAEEKLATAKSALDDVTIAKDDALKSKDSATTALNDAKFDASKKELALNSAKNTLDSASTVKDNADASVKAAKTALGEYNQTQANIDSTQSDITKLKNDITDLETKQNELNDNIDKANQYLLKAHRLEVMLQGSVDSKKAYLDALKEVKEKGSKADLSNVDDTEFVYDLKMLASEVDKLNEIEGKLSQANVEYFKKLADYEDAKKEQQQAQGVYDDAMKALDKYIEDNAKHAFKSEEKKAETSISSTPTKGSTSTSKTNTGVRTNGVTSAVMMGLAGLGIVELKRKKKDN